MNADDTTAGGLSPEELEEEMTIELPDREALSVVIPLGITAAPAAASKGAAAMTQAAEEAPVEELAQSG